MLVTAALSLFVVQGLTAKDFMPLVPGTKWTYQETGEQCLTYVYSAEESKKIGGVDAFPIVVRYKGNILSTTFYVVDEGSAAIAAEDGSNPYSPPRTLFKVGPDPQSWSYVGEIPFNNKKAPLSLTGSSHLGANRKVLGEDVETLEVTIDATVTIPKKPPITQHQVAIYARGIGLVEMTMTATLNGQKHDQHLELIKLKRPGAEKD